MVLQQSMNFHEFPIISLSSKDILNWLVGQGHPSEKWWSSSIGMMTATQYFWENAKNANQSPPTSKRCLGWLLHPHGYPRASHPAMIPTQWCSRENPWPEGLDVVSSLRILFLGKLGLFFWENLGKFLWDFFCGTELALFVNTKMGTKIKEPEHQGTTETRIIGIHLAEAKAATSTGFTRIQWQNVETSTWTDQNHWPSGLLMFGYFPKERVITMTLWSGWNLTQPELQIEEVSTRQAGEKKQTTDNQPI